MSDDRPEPVDEAGKLGDDPDAGARDEVRGRDDLDPIDEDPTDDDLDVDPTDDGEAAAPRATRKPRGTYLGAAMLGLQQAMFGKVKEDVVIQIEASGDPPNLDLDGLDAPFGADARLVGPPLDEIKARARRRRRRR